MKIFARYILPVVLVGLSVLILVIMVNVSKNRQPDKKEETAKAILVDVIPVKTESINLIVESQGTVLPRTETVLISEVNGKVVKVSENFIAGGFFKKGETLLQIDPSDYRAALKRSQANLASQNAQLADQQARSDQALKDWQNLGRTGEPSDLTLRKPQLAEAKAGVLAAEADLQKAERDLERTTIKAPYDGLVRSKQVDIGQYVGAGSNLGITFAIDVAEIRLPLAVADLEFLELPGATDKINSDGTPVQLSAESSGLKGSWPARVVRTEGVIDQNSRVIYAVAQVDDPYGVLVDLQHPELRMGTFVRAEIQGIWIENIVVLPRSALHEDDSVLLASQENELEIRKVEVLRAEPRVVYIRSGLQNGDQVITTAIEAPLPGSRLVISKDTASTVIRAESTTAARADQ